MTTRASIAKQDSTFIVSGDLNFSTVTQVWRDSLPLLSPQQKLLFDFSQVKSANSAGLALIIEWLKYAKREAKVVQLQHFPQQLWSIAGVSGVDQLLRESIS
ncbi:MAG: hypothetical protein A3E84_01915 [Gammaproteobacteria bacterium RIFCSPHIGHO2_12_FULL_42_13]|nr:MAG: hypothetical protein A3E84_01915 [Gammaproteobacteria bacterium RIFCSPHIGHO2_12_FULL_42_13]